ncbi:hypothetical protein SLEP1_g18926 [Rubroshorea leprosula]|uniref:Uncharacterized protein n=1 Tax=Rubroshorea leprosula TaxID=152421 RepID=A0AAV5J542_9ROSI|nr:hypothetical protein SLEP1_g18926 [Rubroshorea leprosula]
MRMCKGTWCKGLCTRESYSQQVFSSLACTRAMLFSLAVHRPNPLWSLLLQTARQRTEWS